MGDQEDVCFMMSSAFSAFLYPGNFLCKLSASVYQCVLYTLCCVKVPIEDLVLKNSLLKTFF